MLRIVGHDLVVSVHDRCPSCSSRYFRVESESTVLYSSIFCGIHVIRCDLVVWNSCLVLRGVSRTRTSSGVRWSESGRAYISRPDADLSATPSTRGLAVGGWTFMRGRRILYRLAYDPPRS